MTTQEVLCRHFSRIGARVTIRELGARQRGNFAVDVINDRYGELFELRCREQTTPEVIDSRPDMRHLVLMVRDGAAKNKYLLGHDERHWFAAAVPGNSVRDVRTAIASLRPDEIGGREAIRQGEWFFVPAGDVELNHSFIFRNEPLSRGLGSKSHMCEELTRTGGVPVMVSSSHPTGLGLAEYEQLIATDPKAQRIVWRRMVRDAEVIVRGNVRHPDHKTVWLDGWHRVYMNRERFAPHAVQVAFLD